MSITTRGVTKSFYHPDGSPAAGVPVTYDLTAAPGFPYAVGGVVIPRSVTVLTDATGLSRAELWCNETESEVESSWRATIDKRYVSTAFSVPAGAGDIELDVCLQLHGDPAAPPTRA